LLPALEIVAAGGHNLFTYVFESRLDPGWQHAAGWGACLDRLDAHLAGGSLSEEEAHAGIGDLLEHY
jgi:hypothetical protein